MGSTHILESAPATGVAHATCSPTAPGRPLGHGRPASAHPNGDRRTTPARAPTHPCLSSERPSGKRGRAQRGTSERSNPSGGQAGGQATPRRPPAHPPSPPAPARPPTDTNGPARCRNAALKLRGRVYQFRKGHPTNSKRAMMARKVDHDFDCNRRMRGRGTQDDG